MSLQFEVRNEPIPRISAERMKVLLLVQGDLMPIDFGEIWAPALFDNKKAIRDGVLAFSHKFSDQQLSPGDVEVFPKISISLAPGRSLNRTTNGRLPIVMKLWGNNVAPFSFGFWVVSGHLESHSDRAPFLVFGPNLMVTNDQIIELDQPKVNRSVHSK